MVPPGHTQAGPPADSDEIRRIAEDLKGLEGPLLPILHAVNDSFGYVDACAVPVIAEVLNLSQAEVHGTISFYHDFRRTPPGRHTVKVCRAEACQSMGADGFYEDLKKACGGDGEVTVEPVYCLGNCALSPAALVDGELHGRLDTAKTMALLDK
jgi:formate dehydrogenase subunit gamma